MGKGEYYASGRRNTVQESIAEQMGMGNRDEAECFPETDMPSPVGHVWVFEVLLKTNKGTIKEFMQRRPLT